MNTTLPPWPKKQYKKHQKKLTPKQNKAVDKAIDAVVYGKSTVVTQDTIEHIHDPEIKAALNNDSNVVFKPNEGPQSDFLSAPEREVLYGGAKGGGKLLKLNTILPTPSGYSTIRDIKVGDSLFAEDGQITKVLWKSDIQTFNSYEVHFSSGEVITCDGGHLWKVSCIYGRTKKDELIVTTQHIYENIKNKHGQLNFSVENCSPIKLPTSMLPIDSYTFGCWLGDGISKDAVVASVKAIKELGVYKNKHIPLQYLRSSFEQRLSLLQGIMDTDGSCSKEGKCSLTLKTKRLMEDVQELICSLGIKTTIKRHIAKSQTRYSCEVYRVVFYSTLPIFKLKRKLSRQKREGLRPTVLRRYITKVVPIENCDMQCLKVDHPSSTFLLGRTFIKTHNSYALMVDPLRYMGSKHSRALIIRRSTPDLRDMINKALQIYDKAYPGVKWVSQQNLFRFPSGASIEFTYCETASDLPRFQGINMTYCGLDEAASHPYLPELLNYIRSNIRSVDPVNAPPMLRMTANPGEVMSNYLREEFVEKTSPNTTFWETIKVYDARKKEHKIVHISKKYIPATVFDNPALLQDDSYLATLASLPEVKRKQWLEGDWFVNEASAFPEFNRNLHVVPSFEIPRDWKRIKGCDWGFASPGCVVWGAISPEGQIIIYREFVYQNKDALTVAQEGKALELGEMKSLGILDASAWQNRGTLGESIGEIFQIHWGPWTPSSRARTQNMSSRAHRTNLIHQHLAIDPMTGNPRMVIFPQCRKLIEAITSIPTDKANPECMDTNSKFDHYPDALSYLLQGRPLQHKGWGGDFGRPATQARYITQDVVFGY